MNPEKVICKCKNVTKGDVLKAIEQGARTYKDVREMTGAGAKCGQCEKTVRSFIKKHRKFRGSWQDNSQPGKFI